MMTSNISRRRLLMAGSALAAMPTFGLMAQAQADESIDQEAATLKQMHEHNFLGKRPYAKAPVATRRNTQARGFLRHNIYYVVKIFRQLRAAKNLAIVSAVG